MKAENIINEAFVKAKNKCFVDREIRRLFDLGFGEGPLADAKGKSIVEPSSLDVLLGSELFILDDDAGLFRPEPKKQIYRSLLELPRRNRQKVSIADGFELHAGHTYVIPLQQKLRLFEYLRIKSSPKSSRGRLFINTRLLADYNTPFDEVSYGRVGDEMLNLWLLVQPLRFNVSIKEGIALNQLRFLYGDPKLSHREVQNMRPILHTRDRQNNLVPIKDRSLTDGSELHMNAKGEETHGVIALRAKKNPMPIDLTKKKEYNVDDYFEPIKSKSLVIHPGEFYLAASKEVLKLPETICAELQMYSHIGFAGFMHFAGFADNFFTGDLVFEIAPKEITKFPITSNIPLSKLDFYRTNKPDRVYNEKNNSYQFQIGPKPSNNFVFDPKTVARTYKKLNKFVLVQDKNVLNELREQTDTNAFQPVTPDLELKLYEAIKNGFFHSRFDCERDNLVWQPIPYVMVFGPNKTMFAYVRAQKVEDYGDERLFGKHSIGLGGHIIKEDGPNYAQAGYTRELNEEVNITGSQTIPQLVGTIVAPEKEPNDVNNFHFALVYTTKTNGDVIKKETSIQNGRLLPIKDIINDPLRFKKYERWSWELFPFLEQLYEQSG